MQIIQPLLFSVQTGCSLDLLFPHMCLKKASLFPKEREERNMDRPCPQTSVAATSTAQEYENTAMEDDDYRLPVYLHDAPWPSPRPTAEVAARARSARRFRTECGRSTAEDARAELEERVSSSLIGVVPEEYCRDAPRHSIGHNGGERQREIGFGNCVKAWMVFTHSDDFRWTPSTSRPSLFSTE